MLEAQLDTLELLVADAGAALPSLRSPGPPPQRVRDAAASESIELPVELVDWFVWFGGVDGAVTVDDTCIVPGVEPLTIDAAVQGYRGMLEVAATSDPDFRIVGLDRWFPFARLGHGRLWTVDCSADEAHPIRWVDFEDGPAASREIRFASLEDAVSNWQAQLRQGVFIVDPAGRYIDQRFV
jgi:hypothetical protein